MLSPSCETSRSKPSRDMVIGRMLAPCNISGGDRERPTTCSTDGLSRWKGSHRFADLELRNRGHEAIEALIAPADLDEAIGFETIGNPDDLSTREVFGRLRQFPDRQGEARMIDIGDDIDCDAGLAGFGREKIGIARLARHQGAHHEGDEHEERRDDDPA